MFLVAGAGWVAETVVNAQRRAAVEAQKQAYSPRPAAAPLPRDALGAVMGSVADDDPLVCTVFTPPARAQLAAAFDVADCPAAVHAWHAQVVRPSDYGLSPRLRGDASTVSPDRETATVTGRGLRWYSPLTGDLPDAGPPSRA